MMGHRMVETCPDRAVTPRDRQPWLHKCHRGLVPSKHHVDSSDSDRDSPFLDNRSPGSRGESNRIPPPSLLGRHSTGRTAPRLPPCVRTAAELAKLASHPIEGSAPFPTARFHRHRPCCDVPLTAAGASLANHTRQHREHQSFALAGPIGVPAWHGTAVNQEQPRLFRRLGRLRTPCR